MAFRLLGERSGIISWADYRPYRRRRQGGHRRAARPRV